MKGCNGLRTPIVIYHNDMKIKILTSTTLWPILENNRRTQKKNSS